MKLLHLADLHLGKRVKGFDLLEDQRHILQEILSLCDAHGVNAVLIAGDLYDTPVPPAAATTLLDGFLTELCARGIAVLAIGGNHDSGERLNYASTLLARQDVHLAGRFTGQAPQVVLQDEHGPVEFVLLPFARAATVRHYLPEQELPDFRAAQAAALATAAPLAERRVVLAHLMVLHAEALPLFAGSESCTVNVGTVEAVDSALFDDFCYGALGHIHRPQPVGRDTLRYAGAPLGYHVEECGAEKSCILVTLGAHGVDDVQPLPLHPRRAMRHLVGPLARLVEHPQDTDDYIWATLTDETPIPDAISVLRAAYPNVMQLGYRVIEGDATLPDSAAAIQNKPFETLFAEFFEKMNGRPLNEAELRAVRTLQEEVSL